MRLSRDPVLEDGETSSSPFFTALILHSLNPLGGLPGLHEIMDGATGYLMQERETGDCWRFFGKGSEIAPDVDVTACVLAALHLNGAELDYDAAAGGLQKYRDQDGLFNTWIWDRPNCVDAVVNANVLFFCAVIGRSFSAIEDHLCRMVQTGSFQGGTDYYKSPVSCLYYISRLYADRRMDRFYAVVPTIRKYLLARQDKRGGWGNPLEDIMGTLTLLNTGPICQEVERAVDYVRNNQQSDGGWPIAAFSYYWRREKIRFYGSRELNTAMALEALWKFRVKKGC